MLESHKREYWAVFVYKQNACWKPSQSLFCKMWNVKISIKLYSYCYYMTKAYLNYTYWQSGRMFGHIIKNTVRYSNIQQEEVRYSFHYSWLICLVCMNYKAGFMLHLPRMFLFFYSRCKNSFITFLLWYSLSVGWYVLILIDHRQNYSSTDWRIQKNHLLKMTMIRCNVMSCILQ